MRHRLILAALTGAVLAGCQQAEAPPAPAAAPATPAAQTAAPPAAAPTPDSYSFGPEISVEDFVQHVKVLASDEFEGRAPGTRGEELTTSYLKTQFERLGLKPGNGDSFFQRVPMTETTARPAPATVTAAGGANVSWSFGDQYVVGTRTGQPEVKIENSELVFVGYGVNAPEADWNDYAGLDVKGKTVVILVNDPGFHAGDESLFGGKRMTYYGRWTYKFEEAARQGAAAALVVHDDAGAGYGWDVVRNSWSGAQYDLPASDDPEPRLPLQGWINGEVASALFAAAGLTLDEQRAAANKPGFKAVPLKATFSSTIQSQIRSAESNNVIALLPGTDKPDEAVIYMGHWDHLGKHEGEGDQIYNGAIDNATGIAGILEIAEQFTVQDPKPARSVLFMAVTLEESGLLGSKYYVAHPVIPLANTVGVINLDAMTVVGRTRDIVVNGFGASELEDLLRPIADAQQRVMHAEASVEKGFYYRSDHFNFAKAGVPALYAKSGLDAIEGGEAHGMAISDEYGANRYHKPADEFDPSWDLGGVMQDLNALYLLGRELAGGDAWPNWKGGNEFKAARDAMMAEKAKAAK
ncbi:M28 family metallopeptidase [Chiayiivirga flava]|uniref:Zn-dependent M28 family amino/carboxypeptidase n=1 Tax=Chiayiivirga flava TaxID=659595 RepID=A0A7W8D7D2_9GAMM|nr:M28 family metallopeptidase [Chiayiivirga flava]MBB5208140.1 Zn-dependent M28 family amino/carboxypeptidase [Chiayiivirga flava]